MTKLIIFFMIETKLDIAFFIIIATSFFQNSSHTSIKAVKKSFTISKNQGITA